MKKLFVALFVIGLLPAFSFAQTSAQTAVPQMSKEDKAKMKAQQEADLTSSFKDAGLTEDQTAKARQVLDDATKKSNELKKNTSLTDADKEVEKKKINDEKNAKLKEIMGDKYKAWTKIRKEQKEKMTGGQ